MELADELENDLALVMLIERRHAAKIGSRQARDLIERVKGVLADSHPSETGEPGPQDLATGFAPH